MLSHRSTSMSISGGDLGAERERESKKVGETQSRLMDSPVTPAAPLGLKRDCWSMPQAVITSSYIIAHDQVAGRLRDWTCTWPTWAAWSLPITL